MDPVRRNPSAVPDQVRAAAEREASAMSRIPHCNRYFEDSLVVVVLFSSFCGGGELVKETDSRLLAAFNPDGQLIGTIEWLPLDGVAEVIPFVRTISR